MANIKAKLTPRKNVQVTNFKLNASTMRVGDIFDINTQNASDGAHLVYNESDETWEATTKIDNVNTTINGGHY